MPSKKPTKKQKQDWPPGDKHGLPRPGDISEMILDGRWAAAKAAWLGLDSHSSTDGGDGTDEGSAP